MVGVGYMCHVVLALQIEALALIFLGDEKFSFLLLMILLNSQRIHQLVEAETSF